MELWMICHFCTLECSHQFPPLRILINFHSKSALQSTTAARNDTNPNLVWKMMMSSLTLQRFNLFSAQWNGDYVPVLSVDMVFYMCVCVCVCFCFFVCFVLFNCISFHSFSRHLSAFWLCSSAFISALLVLSTIYPFMKVFCSLDIILVDRA